MKRAANKLRPVTSTATESVEEALERELSGIDGFEQGRQLRGQIIDLGDKMRELRENVLKMNQTSAAKLIGMEQPELSRIENGIGSRGPSYSTIIRIIEAYENYLRSQNRDYHLGLSIQLRNAGTDEVEQSFLAGGA